MVTGEHWGHFQQRARGRETSRPVLTVTGSTERAEPVAGLVQSCRPIGFILLKVLLLSQRLCEHLVFVYRNGGGGAEAPQWRYSSVYISPTIGSNMFPSEPDLATGKSGDKFPWAYRPSSQTLRPWDMQPCDECSSGLYGHKQNMFYI